MPGVEVGADDDDLVLEVGAGDLADQILGLLALLADPVADLDLDFDRDVALEDAVHAVVMLDVHRQDGQGGHGRLIGPLVVTRAGPRKADD